MTQLPRWVARGWTASSVETPGSALLTGVRLWMATVAGVTRTSHRLAWPDLAGWDGIHAGSKRDQTVFADPAQMPIGDQIRVLGQWAQRGVITPRAYPDDLTVRAVNLAPANRYPPAKRVVALGGRVERSPGQHMITDDVDLAFHASFSGRSMRG